MSGTTWRFFGRGRPVAAPLALAAALAAILAAALAGISPARAASTTLVVNEVLSGDSHANSHEFIEVRNVSPEDQHADLLELRYQGTSSTTGEPSATVTTLYTFPVGTIIPAGGYYLVTSDTYRGHSAHAAQSVNGTFESLFSGAISTTGAVALFDAAGNRVDSVGWGNSPAHHPFVETSAAPLLASNVTIERVSGQNGASQDTDDNSVDFALTLEPSPTSTPYTPNVPVVSVTATPDHLEPGALAQVSATVTPTASPVSAVTMDLSALGGASDAPLANSSGTTWMGTFTVPASQAAGPITLIVRATDTQGKYGTGGAALFIYPGPPITVAEAKARTPNTGDLVRVRGIVVAARTGYAYIADPGVNGGIAVADGNQRDSIAPLEPGQDVTITGRITREDWYSSSDPTKLIYRGEARLDTATGKTADIVVNSTGNALPVPRAITLSELASDGSLVGQLVTVSGITVEKVPTKVAAATGDNIQLVPALGAASTWVAVSRSATDQTISPYPGLAPKPIPATVDTNFYVPWIAANDVFDVRGVVGITSVGINTTTGLVSPKVLRVRDAADFVLTNNAKFIGGGATPSPAEQGRSARFRVIGYPVDTASVTVDLSGIGLGPVALPGDGHGGYAADVLIPAAAPLGSVTAPVTVSANNKTATGSITFTVSAPTTNPGDVDRSGGAPTLSDAALALRVAGGLTAGTDNSVSVANGDVFPQGAPDGRLSLGDALRILRAARGLESL